MQHNTDSAKCYTITTLAAALGCSTKTIRRMHNAGRLPAPFRLPGSTIWKWREKDILRYLDELSSGSAS